MKARHPPLLPLSPPAGTSPPPDVGRDLDGPGAAAERERRGGWEALQARMRLCELCSLARSRTQVVTYRGAPAPWVLLVGEAPGREEDRLGRPFVGRAGGILDRAAREAGLREEEWGVTNVIMCRPPSNRFDREAARACRPWLAAKVAELAPRVIVTLGAQALEAFLPQELPVSRAAGRVLAWGSRPLFPMLHPAATLRSRAYAARWQADWARFATHLATWRAGAAAR